MYNTKDDNGEKKELSNQDEYTECLQMTSKRKRALIHFKKFRETINYIIPIGTSM